jgi:hypothetical protein
MISPPDLADVVSIAEKLRDATLRPALRGRMPSLLRLRAIAACSPPPCELAKDPYDNRSLVGDDNNFANWPAAAFVVADVTNCESV